VRNISPVLRGRLSRFIDAVYFFPTIAAVLLALVWFTTFNLIQAEFSDARQSARTLGRELLETYEAQVLRSLNEIDQSIKIILYARQWNDHTDTLKTLETHDLLPSTMVFSICIIDENGRVISSTDTGYSCTSNPRFLAQLAQTDALAISNPAQSASEALSFGRPIIRNGETAGAVIITVEPAYFVSGYESGKYGLQGLNGLIGTDAAFRALRIGDVISAGKQAQIDFNNLQTDGSLRTYLDGVKRYTFARQLFGYPLTAIVGLSEEEQLAGAYEIAETYVLRAAAGSLFLIIVFVALFRESWLLGLSRKREQEQAAQVEYMAYHDTLTGLANRSLFNRLLQQELLLSKRHERIFSLLFLDLDKFKQINDTMGHAVGDKLLIEVAQRLTSCLRTSDVVARIGGDEFVAMLPCQKENGCAEAVAKKIISTVAEPYTISGNTFSITVSIGISMYPKDGLDEHALMKNADTAMYHAKTHGRNNYQLYTAELSHEGGS